LTREGWYFLFVLLFVIGGAVARQLNLLVLLAGMMIGPLVLHARWVSRMLRNLRVERRLPHRVHAGEPLYVRLGIHNERSRTAAWLLYLEDQIRQTAGPAISAATTSTATTLVPVGVPMVKPQCETWVTYRAHFPQRGQYQFGPVTVKSRFPLGLLEAARAFDVPGSLLVLPKLGRMTEAWRQLILGESMGVQASQNRQGLIEADYYGLREWRQGDSARWIHWRTSARLPTLAVRQFERQRNFCLLLLVDLHLPPHPTADQLRVLELAVSCAATALTDLVRCGSGWLAVAIAGKTASCHAGQATAAFVQEVIDRLATESGGEGHLERAAELLVKHRPAGATGVVISTRADQRHKLRSRVPLSHAQSAVVHSLAWLDVSSPMIERFFRWKDSTPGHSTSQPVTLERHPSGAVRT
jgi:uncharacterized protein (DUF58 family)